MATVRLQLRRGLADDWSDANPTLAAGEIGIETDTNTFKFGDGSTPWNSLEYALSGTVDDYIALSSKGVANGVASLDGSGLIPIAQLPGAAALDAEVSSAISTHNDDTTSVHGIADTSALATKTYADSAVSTHNSDTTDVHGISDTSILVTTTGSQTLMSKSLTSPTLTGTPVAPTATVGTDTTQIATTAFVQDAIEAVIGAAPDALNTLAEIASSLNDDADLSGTLTTAISEKVAKSGDTMSGALNMGTNKITGLGAPTSLNDATNKSYVDQAIGNNLSDHSSDQTNVHGITNTQDLVYTDDVRLSDLREPQDTSVTTAKLVDLSVTTAKINDSAVTEGKIGTDAVTTSKINALAITTAKIADSSVTNAKIADGSVTIDKLDSASVTEAKIAGSAVTTDKIADSAVTSLKVATSAVTTEKINDSAVTTDKINDSAVTENKIADINVTTPKIADSAITTDKINASAVTEAKLASLAVTEGKIADGSVSTVKIADSAVTSGKIAAGTIVDSDISSSAAIATSKIDGLDAAISSKLDSATAASTYAPIANPTFTGTVGGVTKAHVGLGDVDNTSDANKPVSTATQTALDLKAPKADPTFTGTVVLPSTVNGPSISTSVNLLFPTQSGHITLGGSQTTGNLTLGGGTTRTTGVIGIGTGATTTGTKTINIGTGSTGGTTEITVGSSSGATSNITLNGSVTAKNNLVVDGDFTVNGTNFSASATSITIEDNMVQLAHQNSANTVDLGLVVAYNDGAAKHAGLVRDVSDSKWKLFKGVTTEPSTTVDFTEGSLDDLAVAGLTASSLTVGSVSNTEIGYLDGVTSGIQTQIDSKAPKADPTFTGTVTVGASGIAFTDGAQTKQGVPSLTTIASATTGAYNLSTGGLALRDQLIPIGGTHAITIPTNSTTAFPVGTSISFYQSAGTGGNFVAADGTVTILSTPGSTLRTTNSSATITKVATNTWLLAGDLKA